jgi:hypothetical protein
MQTLTSPPQGGKRLAYDRKSGTYRASTAEEDGLFSGDTHTDPVTGAIVMSTPEQKRQYASNAHRDFEAELRAKTERSRQLRAELASNAHWRRQLGVNTGQWRRLLGVAERRGGPRAPRTPRRSAASRVRARDDSGGDAAPSDPPERGRVEPPPRMADDAPSRLDRIADLLLAALATEVVS